MADQDPEYTNALIEQRIAELSPEEFDALVARTRPPVAPKGNVIPGVGNIPNQPTESDRVAAAEREGDFKTASAIKTAHLNRLIREQNRGW